jgi:glycosyltransferase involved in cell wall biosynthesis
MQPKFRPALGVSDFKKVVSVNPITGEKPIYFDKTLMIKDILEDPSDFLLFTRPRRFGKTLNMSMLKYFFDSEEDIFSDLEIGQYPNIIEKFHGKIPTIFLSLKDVTGASYEQMLSQMSFVITSVYSDFSGDLNEGLLKYSKDILLSEDELIKSLRKLSQRLYEKYNQQVLILLDEYDTPLNNAYVEGHLDKAVKLFRSFFAQSFKDNPYLYKGVMTGINRVAKENIFSGLNNFKTEDIDSKKYAKYFGFTEVKLNHFNFQRIKKMK